MKLTKLLPIATVVSVASIVTPLVTSCSKAGKLEFDFSGGKEFSPVVDRKKDDKKYNEQTALDEYLSDVSKNKLIAASDSMCTSAYYYEMIGGKQYITEYKKSFEVTKVNKDKHYLSIKISCNMDIDYDGKPYYYVFDVELNNIDYICEYQSNEGDNHHWHFRPVFHSGGSIEDWEIVLALNEDWSIKGTWGSTMPDNEEKQTYEVNINYLNFIKSDFYKNGMFQLIGQETSLSSDYFEDIQYGE